MLPRAARRVAGGLVGWGSWGKFVAVRGISAGFFACDCAGKGGLYAVWRFVGDAGGGLYAVLLIARRKNSGGLGLLVRSRTRRM